MFLSLGKFWETNLQMSAWAQYSRPILYPGNSKTSYEGFLAIKYCMYSYSEIGPIRRTLSYMYNGGVRLSVFQNKNKQNSYKFIYFK